MNIKKHTLNIFFNLTIIISFIFSSNSIVSAEEKEQDQLPQTETTLTKEDTNEEITKLKTDLLAEIKNEINDLSLENLLKKNSAKYILLFWAIDLPILVILLVVLYLGNKQQQKQIDKLNKILGQTNKINSIEQQVNTLELIQDVIIKSQKGNSKIIKSQEILLESFNKLQSNQSVNHNLYSNGIGFNTYGTSESFNQDQLTTKHNTTNFDTITVDRVSQLVETYNRNKYSFSESAIDTVEETQTSNEQRRSGQSNTVKLEHTAKKKYWIVEEDNNYYLVPHPDMKTNEHSVKTLEALFECINFTSEYIDFELVQPAKITQISNQTWQLEEKGKLNFF
jgi:hypothetical protein